MGCEESGRGMAAKGLDPETERGSDRRDVVSVAVGFEVSEDESRVVGVEGSMGEEVVVLGVVEVEGVGSDRLEAVRSGRTCWAGGL